MFQVHVHCTLNCNYIYIYRLMRNVTNSWDLDQHAPTKIIKSSICFVKSIRHELNVFLFFVVVVFLLLFFFKKF